MNDKEVILKQIEEAELGVRDARSRVEDYRIKFRTAESDLIFFKIQLSINNKF